MSPDFLIIGAARSGTTALASYLAQHPQIFMTQPKEPHFMAFAGRRLDFRGPGDDVMMNQVVVTDRSRYQQLYRQANGQIAGEGSVSTLYYYQQAIPNIEKYAPNAKLIVLLRNPVERAFSSFLYMRSKGYESIEDFDQALDEEDRRFEENWHHIWHYRRMGRYVEQLKAFLDTFGKDRVKVITYEDFDEHTPQVVQTVLDFLGADQSFRPKTDVTVNSSGTPRNWLVKGLFQSMVRSTYLRYTLKAMFPFVIRERLRNLILHRPVLAQHTRARLEEDFVDEIRQLEQLLHVDLERWFHSSRHAREHVAVPSESST
ncbi:MAG: sulfotransferase [Pirellulaceae bacterium]